MNNLKIFLLVGFIGVILILGYFYFSPKNKMPTFWLKEEYDIDSTYLNNVFFVKIGNDKKCYVINLVGQNKFEIKIFNEQGKLIHNIDDNGRAPNEFLYPINIVFDNEGKFMYILDIENRKILVYNLKNYNFIKSYSCLAINTLGSSMCFTSYKKKNVIFLSGLSNNNSSYFIYYLDLATGEIKGLEGTKVRLKNQTDYFKYIFMSILGYGTNKIQFLSKKTGDVLYIYSLEKSKIEQKIRLKGIPNIKDNQLKHSASKLSTYQNLGQDIILLGTMEEPKFFIWDIKNDVRRVQLKFDSRKYKKDYEDVISGQKKAKTLFEKSTFKYYLSVNPNLKILAIQKNMNKVSVFRYKLICE